VEVGDLGDMFGDFSDFFNTIFGGMAGQDFTRRSRGRTQDIEQTVNISLLEAFNGTTRIVHVDGRKIEVSIPRGSKTGTRVRINLQKGSLHSASGNLYLLVNVAPDPYYERIGDDLYVEVDLDLYSAVLGGERRVQTPAGDVMLTIPPGSQPAQTLRLQGRGMPKLRNPTQHGDLYARLQVELPKNLSRREKELFQELAKLKGQ
jgi:curved DNA-binding protein